MPRPIKPIKPTKSTKSVRSAPPVQSAQSAQKKLKPLKSHDRVRMARLFEKITGNVQEMSTIMNRLHGTPVFWTKFQISTSDAAAADGPVVITVVCNEKTGECGCYDHEAGTCGPCPAVDL
ncbi:MAG: hypothetical protein ABI284_03040 [Nitrosospira sp.]